MRTHLLLFTLLLIAGCGPSIIPYTATTDVQRGYSIGTASTVSAGEVMLAITGRSSAPTYTVVKDYTPPQHDSWKGGLDYPPLTKGMRFSKIADRSDGVIGIYNPGYQITVPGALTRAERKEDITIWIEPSGVVSETMEGRAWVREPLFAEEKTSGGSAYKGELIYTGRQGNMVTMEFRENTGGSGPMTTAVKHDLDGGGTFTLRDITIEILNAHESSIEYRVVSDDGLAWVR